MTRFKKELVKRGFRLEHTEECLPARDGFEWSHVYPDKMELHQGYVFAVVRTKFDRGMNVVEEVYE